MVFLAINFLPLFLAGLVVVLGLALVMYKSQKKDLRSQELAQTAKSLGLNFSETDKFGFTKQLQGFDLFEQEASKWGRSGKITNVMSGTTGETKVWLFDYSYLVSTGKSVVEIKQTVFFADDKKWYLPNFKLKPERWWHKMLAKLGIDDDIDFPENPDFSDRFLITGGFEDLIKKQFSPDLQQFFEERPPVHIEGENYYLVAYKPGKILTAEESRTFFEHCCQLTQLLQREEGNELLELADVKVPISIEKKS